MTHLQWVTIDHHPLENRQATYRVVIGDAYDSADREWTT